MKGTWWVSLMLCVLAGSALAQTQQEPRYVPDVSESSWSIETDEGRQCREHATRDGTRRLCMHMATDDRSPGDDRHHPIRYAAREPGLIPADGR
jgi:hypothetical protein